MKRLHLYSGKQLCTDGKKADSSGRPVSYCLRLRRRREGGGTWSPEEQRESAGEERESRRREEELRESVEAAGEQLV